MKVYKNWLSILVCACLTANIFAVNVYGDVDDTTESSGEGQETTQELVQAELPDDPEDPDNTAEMSEDLSDSSEDQDNSDVSESSSDVENNEEGNPVESPSDDNTEGSDELMPDNAVSEDLPEPEINSDEIESEVTESGATASVQPLDFVDAPLTLSRNATLIELSYVNGKYVYNNEEHNSFPTSGSYILMSDMPISAQVAVNGELSIDLGGFTITDTITTSKQPFSVQQNDILNISGTGTIQGNSNVSHCCIFINNGGVVNMSGGTIDGFRATGVGGGVSVNHKDDVFTMSGNATIQNCGVTNNGHGGGVGVRRGTFYMTDNACVTGCYILGTPAEKNGNGAGISIGESATMYLSGNATVTNNTGVGYHGAGIDLWSNSHLYLSGSPTVLNNTNGRNEPCNLYVGPTLTINGPLTGAPNSIGISIQTYPTFTSGLLANNPGSTIDDLLAIFDADRYHWTSIPRASEYEIIDDNGTEAKVAPTITVYYMTNYGNNTVWKTQEMAPGGQAVSPGNPTRTGYNFGGWYRTPQTTGSAWSFSNNNVPHDADLYLYAKWTLKTYNMTVTVTGDSDQVVASSSATVNYGSDWTFSATANQGYKIVSVKIDNVTQTLTDDPTTDYTHLFSAIDRAHSVTIDIAPITYTVQATVVNNADAAHWTFSNYTAPVQVQHGSGLNISGSVDAQYYLVSATLNNQPLTLSDYAVSDTDYSFDLTNITEDTTLEIEVGQMVPITITASGEPTALSVSSTPSHYSVPNSSEQITIQVEQGYIIEAIYIDNVLLPTPLGLDVYTWEQNVGGSGHSIEVRITQARVIIPEATGFAQNKAPIIALLAVVGTLFGLALKTKRRGNTTEQ